MGWGWEVVEVEWRPVAPTKLVQAGSPDVSTRLLWIVYPKNRVVDVYRPGQPVQTLTIDDDLDGDPVVPGFRIPLRSIFTD